MLFLKTTSMKIAVMQLLPNGEENPCVTPVKKLISSKVEAVVL